VTVVPRIGAAVTAIQYSTTRTLLLRSVDDPVVNVRVCCWLSRLPRIFRVPVAEPILDTFPPSVSVEYAYSLETEVPPITLALVVIVKDHVPAGIEDPIMPEVLQPYPTSDDELGVPVAVDPEVKGSTINCFGQGMSGIRRRR
jgi:hypothetical protein